MVRISHSRNTLLVACLLSLVTFALLLSACGGDGDGDGQAKRNKTEQAFLEGMIPHHEAAVAMARLAPRRAEHSEIRQLAGSIILSQESEIEQMRGIHERLFGRPVVPDENAHEALGLAVEEAGGHTNGAAKLRTAKPFDRAFIDEMVPHHRGAIRQARLLLDDTNDEGLKKLGAAIATAQSREIQEMSDWRERWYGNAVTTNGAPDGHEQDSGSDGEGGGGHSG